MGFHPTAHLIPPKLVVAMSPPTSAVTPPHEFKLDTACSHHYITTNDLKFVTDVSISKHPHTVALADGSTVSSTHEGTLILPGTHSFHALTCHIFPSFTSSLLSIPVPVLCNSSYEALFSISQDGV